MLLTTSVEGANFEAFAHNSTGSKFLSRLQANCLYTVRCCDVNLALIVNLVVEMSVGVDAWATQP